MFIRLTGVNHLRGGFVFLFIFEEKKKKRKVEYIKNKDVVFNVFNNVVKLQHIYTRVIIEI